MVFRKARMKGRVVVVVTHGTPEKVFVGTSAAEIARRMNKSKEAMERAAIKAEQAPDHIYRNNFYHEPGQCYTVYITDELIRGKSRGGGFSYR